MASFLNRLVGGVENFFKGGPQPAQKQQAQQRPAQPRIDPRALQAAMQMAPRFNNFQHLPAPRPAPLPPAHPNLLSRDLSTPLLHILGQTAQQTARGGVRLDTSAAQAAGLYHPPAQGTPVPHLIGGGTVRTYPQQIHSDISHGKNPAAAGLIALGSLAGDLPGVPGKKQAAAALAKTGLSDSTNLAKSASKLRRGQSVAGKSGLPSESRKLSPSSPKSSTPTPLVNGRSFPKTVRQSQTVQANTPITPAQLQKLFKDIPYFREIQKPVLKQAHEDIKANPTKVLNEVLSPVARPTSQHIARGTVLLADALQRGDSHLAESISKSLSSKGTGLGQAVSMFNTINRTTPSGAFHWATNLGADSESAQNFYKRALEVDKMAEGQAKDLARFKLAEDISRLDPSSAGKQGVELWRSLLLTGPRTHTGNLLSNTLEGATKQGLVNPLAAGIDKAVSLVTGKRSRALTLQGIGSGAKTGIGNAKTYIKTGYNPLNPGGKYESGQTTFGNNLFGKVAKGISQPIYRVLGAADQPYRMAARSQALAEQAKAAALNKGLKGQARRDFIKQFIANPPKAALEHSTQIGDRSVFGNQTVLGQIAGAIKRPVNIKGKQVYSGAPGEFVVPFTQVPSSIATRIVERSPVGFVSAARDLVNAARGKGFDQYMFTEKLANAAVGSTASLVVGKELADHNMITLGYPTDPKERELWKEEGKQPYSVKIGGKWHSLNYVQPFGSMLAWGAAYQQARKDGTSPGKAAEQAAAQAGKAVSSQSFLQGVSGALNAVQDPAQNAAKYIESAAQSVVPGLLRNVASATDPSQREVNGPGQAIKAGIPGQRQNLPIKQDNFGNPLPSGNTSVGSSLDSLFNPLKPTAARGGPVTQELRRLQDSKQGIVPTTIQTDSLGKGTNLNGDQKRQLQQAYGQQVQQAWSQIMQDPRYASLSNDAKKKLLGNVSDNVLLAAKAQFAAKNNLPIPKLNTASKLILQGSGSDPFRSAKSPLTPADKYQTALDAYKANQSGYTDAKRIKEQSSLNRLKVESSYSQNVVDLYGLSKAQIYNYITTNPNGNDLATQLQKLDQQLYSSGLTSSLKFKTGFAPKISGGSSRSSGGGAKIATLKTKLPPKPKSVHVGKVPSPRAKRIAAKFPKLKVAKVKTKGVKLSQIS